MRIFTKVVWQWVGESLVRVEERSYEHTGPVALAKGGSSGGPYYGSLERLYNAQAGSAEYLNSIFSGQIGPEYQNYLRQSKESGSIANQEEAAQKAFATGQEALSGQEQALSSNLMSMGIDPSDERYQSMLAKQRTSGAGVMAGQATAERARIKNEGDAKYKGAISLGMGVPEAASQAAGQGINAAQIGMNAYNQNQAQQAQSVSNIARGATNYFGNSNTGGFADGGLVEPGNINLNDRPRVQNPDGTYSTVRTIGINVDGRETVIPTIRDDGYRMTDPEAKAHYFSTGKHFGRFNSVDEATAYAKQLHKDQERQYGQPEKKADGGILRLENGGYVHRMKYGGFLTQPQVQSPPPSVPGRKADPVAGVASGVTMGAGAPVIGGAMTRGAGSALETYGNATGNTSAQLYGTGLRMGASGDEGRQGLQSTIDWANQQNAQAGAELAKQQATQAVDSQLASTGLPATEATVPTVEATAPITEAITPAATELGTAAAAEGTTAATTGAVAGGVEALGAGGALAAGIGTAMPWVGAGLAAYALGSEMGWWKDGGPVNRYANAGRNAAFTDQDEPPPPQQGIGNPIGRYVEAGRIGPYENGAQGGEVDGPGGPKDDKIHAMLSDGEFVMPRGVVLMFGLKHLEGMRQKGLEYEKQQGIT